MTTRKTTDHPPPIEAAIVLQPMAPGDVVSVQDALASLIAYARQVDSGSSADQSSSPQPQRAAA